MIGLILYMLTTKKIGETAAEYLLKNSPQKTNYYLITFKELDNEFTSFVLKRGTKAFKSYEKTQ